MTDHQKVLQFKGEFVERGKAASERLSSQIHISQDNGPRPWDRDISGQKKTKKKTETVSGKANKKQKNPSKTPLNVKCRIIGTTWLSNYNNKATSDDNDNDNNNTKVLKALLEPEKVRNNTEKKNVILV